MGLHGNQSPLGSKPSGLRHTAVPEAHHQASGSTSYVSLFDDTAGDPATDTSAAIYQRFAGQPALRRYQLLANLGARMVDWLPPSASAGPRPGDDRTLPAGYTYFGQFLAHDLSFSGERVPSIVPHGPAADTWVNLRETQLQLESIYGGGPRQFPIGFVCPAIKPQRGRRADDRTHLRLGQISQRTPTGPVKLADDLPRLALPQFDPPVPPGDGPGTAASDALIADPRNDDHPIVSQMAVLFFRLHNHAADRLLADAGAHPTDLRQKLDFYALFERARAVTRYVYHTLVWNDYLRRLLNEAVFQRYAPDPAQPGRPVTFMTSQYPGHVAVEFSHAAFRFGHAMIRSRYELAALFSIDEILDRSSSTHPELMPFDATWLVDWNMFLDDVAGQNAVQPNFMHSRQLGPTVTRMGEPLEFLDDAPGADGQPKKLEVSITKMGRTVPAEGMATRDLVRSASVPMISVEALLSRMAQDPALKAEIARYPLLADAGERARRISTWLNAPSPVGNGPDVAFADEDRDFLAANPPLYFFILFEAGQVGEGRRLGPVGSFILAETLFAKLATPVPTAPGVVPAAAGNTATYVDLLNHPAGLAADVTLAFGAKVPSTLWELVQSLQS